MHEKTASCIMIAMVNMAERKFERSFCNIFSRKDFFNTNARTFERHVSPSSRTNSRNFSDRDRALPMSCQALFPCGKAKTFSCPEDKIKFCNLMSSKTANFRIRRVFCILQELLKRETVTVFPWSLQLYTPSHLMRLTPVY